jgi:RNA polymerase sigma-70 factor (ECF subfamily)
VTEASIDHEAIIRQAFCTGDLEATASATMRAYGEEVFAFVCARIRSRDDAQEVFAMFSEDLWTTLPRFAWRCSMRTWAYALARHASLRFLNAPARRIARNQPLSLPGAVSQIALEARNATPIYQKTGVKDGFRALREQLDGDDQILLMLRVDRNMEWRDIAIALDGDQYCSEVIIARSAARLRKAFERIKRDLRRMAEAEGLIEARDRTVFDARGVLKH